MSDPLLSVTSDYATGILMVGSDGHLWVTAQMNANVGLSAWTSQGGGVRGQPCLVQTSTDSPQVFAQDGDGVLQTTWQNGRGSARWEPWRAIDEGTKVRGNPTAVVGPSGAIEVFVRDADGQILTTVQTTKLGGPGGRFSPLSVVAPAP